MNPTQKQFSLNRAASKKQIPISQLYEEGQEMPIFAGQASAFLSAEGSNLPPSGAILLI